MSQTTPSPLDAHRELIERLAAEEKSYQEIIDALPVKSSKRSLGRALKRWGVVNTAIGSDKPGISYQGKDEADITGKPTLFYSTPEDLMKERGLDPEEWEVSSLTVNEWDGVGGEINHQLKCHVKRKLPIEMITPARTDGQVFKAAKPKKLKEPVRVVFVGDQQAPYVDEKLHEVFCNFLGWYQPHEGILIGDTIDLPDISRHPHNPEWTVTTQQCIDAGYLVLRDYRLGYEPTRWKKLAGNHDERLRRAVVDRLREIYGLRRAQVPGQEPDSPLVDVAHLLRLDELDIEYIRPDGDYEHMQINVSPHLAARHGWVARKGSGASALATLEHLGYSVVVGHTHRQSLVFKTRHDIGGGLSTLAACETGCMCKIEGGLSYAVAPDWQNGFATAEIWPDGKFNIDLAKYVNETLIYRNMRFS